MCRPKPMQEKHLESLKQYSAPEIVSGMSCLMQVSLGPAIRGMELRTVPAGGSRSRIGGRRLALCGPCGAVHEVFKIAVLLYVQAVIDSPEAAFGSD